MSLVFSASTPHAPLLLSGVGAAYQEVLQPTLSAFKELEGELYVMKPDVLFIFSPHLEIGKGYFPLNGAPKVIAEFSAFGDQTTRYTFNTDMEQVSHLSYATRQQKHTRLKTVSIEKLDYGTAVPLALLASHLPQMKIVSFGISDVSLQEHWNMGKLIRTCIQESNKRIAVIASGDLGHKNSPDSPYGYSPNGQSFDASIQKMIRDKTYADILQLRPSLQEDSGECGLRVFALLFGLLDKLNVEAKILSYQTPFGVGHLVSQYTLQ